jgi:hypothetical protein
VNGGNHNTAAGSGGMGVGGGIGTVTETTDAIGCWRAGTLESGCLP